MTPQDSAHSYRRTFEQLRTAEEREAMNELLTATMGQALTLASPEEQADFFALARDIATELNRPPSSPWPGNSARLQ